MSWTTAPAASAISTPMTMMPTSPRNSRQPCSGLGRWKCISLWLAERGFEPPQRVRPSLSNGQADRVDLGRQRLLRQPHLAGEAHGVATSIAQVPRQIPRLLKRLREAQPSLRSERSLPPFQRAELRPQRLFARLVRVVLREDSIQHTELPLLVGREEAVAAARGRRFPAPEEKGRYRGSPQPCRLSRQRSVSRPREDCLQLPDAPVDARLGPEPVPYDADVERRFGAHVLPRSLGHLSVVKRLHNRFRPKCDENGDDDDPHLARELAPAVERLGEVKVHFRPLPRGGKQWRGEIAQAWARSRPAPLNIRARRAQCRR